MPSPKKTTLWGRAQDGALVELFVRGAGSVREYWPPLGLELLDVDQEAIATLQCEVDSESLWSLAQVESDLGLFAAEHLSSEVAVHAALIRMDSTVVLLPGPSLCGKTTMCVAAHEAGFEVLSDEYALVDPVSGRVRGWPRAIRIRKGDGWDRRAIVTVTSPTKVDLIATLQYESGNPSASALEVEHQSEAQGAMHVLANTVCARVRPHDALQAAVSVCRNTPTLAGTRNEAALALQELLDFMRAFESN